MVGIWYKYDERGFLIEEVTFSKNKENGPFKEFFPSGQLSVSGNYKNGNTEVNFYTSNFEGKYIIDIQSITKDGLMGSQKSIIYVNNDKQKIN